MNTVICKLCGAVIDDEKVKLYPRKKFCSSSCQIKYWRIERKGENKKCIICGRVVVGRCDKVLCSEECKSRHVLNMSLEWYKKNKNIKKEYDKEYLKNNRQKKADAIKRFYERHPERSREHVAKRRSSLLKRVPLWANLDDIKNFYRNCPKEFHVDHIIPLKGKTVSGLHVLNNLQYLPAMENIKKSNHYLEHNGVR